MNTMVTFCMDTSDCEDSISHEERQLIIRTAPIHKYIKCPNLDTQYIADQYQNFYLRYQVDLHELTLMKYLSLIGLILIIGVAILGGIKYKQEH